MNAPATPAAVEATLAEPKIELIPVAAICPSETHIQQLRRKRYDMEGLANLAASIGKLGVQQPGVVRKLPAMRGMASYELVAGERRWRATRQAGLHHFPAIIRELDDTQVLEVQLVENIQRETLHPLEEAVGYDELMKVGKIKADDIGGKVGLSRSWVYSRLNLLKLGGEERKALEDGRLDVSRALVVASVAQPNQRAEALRLALEKGPNDKPMYSVRELRAKIQDERLTMRLRGAPFDMADATLLPDMGGCGGCRFRTGNCDPEALDQDVCTNLSCFHLKVKAQGERTRQAVAEEGGKVLRGEEARRISPSVKTVYDHVDLDHECEADEFPEHAPLAKDLGLDEDADELYQNHPSVRAWHERSDLWQPRTYRALLEGEQYKPVVIEDPKTKAVRELLPFREAQRLLKKRGINLPNWVNRKRPTHHASRSSDANGETSAEAKARQEAEARKREEENAIERAVHIRVLEQVRAKHDGTLGSAELLVIAARALGDLDAHDDVVDHIWSSFGLKDPGWQREKALAKLTAKDLPKILVLGLVAQGLGDGYHRAEEVANAICKRLKVDVKAIEKQVRAECSKPAESSPAKKGGKKKGGKK